MQQAPIAPYARHTRQHLVTEQEFLSYELGKSVKELPPFYTRILGIGISTLLVGTLAWAHFSKVDEVAVASGKLTPSEQMRPVRSIGNGNILSIHVKDGDRVQAGDVLVEKDSSITQAEIDRLEQSAQLIREDIARLEAERTGTNSTGVFLQDQFLAARLRDFESRQAGAIAEANRQLAVMNETRVQLARLQDNLASARLIHANAIERESRMRELASSENGAISQFAYLSIQDELTTAQNNVNSLEREIEAQAQIIQQSEQAYQATLNMSERLGSERQSEVLASLNQRRQDLAALEGQIAAARQQLALDVLQAPISGTIYNLQASVGPVQSGEELLSLLPEGEEMILEARILNRDIGFVEPGMRVKVKIATFPFQEFGTVDGEVISISADAVMDESLGLVFPVKVKLNQQTIRTAGQIETRLLPGMSATGEIVIRQRSVLSFILEPIAKQLSEAFSVR
jgi:HlyD family secretion protein